MATNEETVSILKARNGGAVALKGVSVRARLHELIVEVEVEQSYTNPQNTNIETIYTFPLPIGAVLLGLEVEISGKKLSGHVVERKKAEHDYEDAVTDGNSAVMLQETGPGLYTASIGNLMAKESAVIRYRYGLMLRWQGSKLRFLLPTTIAPRYGDALATGMQPHQVPNSSLDVEYPLSLTVMVEGPLALATIASPTHPLSFERLHNGIVAKVAGRAVLDRDFVLTIESDAMQSSVIYTQDGDEQVAVASLRIPPIDAKDLKSLALKLVIDCSGSMGGISITQARKAALEILNALRPTDSFNVTLFGSECKHIFPRLVPASGKFITEAWNRLEHLDADMGGTEMERALASTFALGGSENPPCVLLITDGEIQEHEKLVRSAARSAHRVFTVGVGTAAVGVFLESLARVTGGACELVSPQEGMAEKILSQFHRLRQPKLEQLRIEWPSAPEWSTPLPKTIFAGDTVHVFAGFSQAVNGAVTLRAAIASQSIGVTAPAMIRAEQELPRIAAANRIKNASQEQALALSLKYQLLSNWTSYLVVDERDEKAGALPELHQVPQMLAAGWGGTGTVSASRKSAPIVRESVYASCGSEGVDDYMPLGTRPIPKASFQTTARGSMAEERAWHTSPKQFIARLEAAVDLTSLEPKLPETLAELDALGLEITIADKIRKLLMTGYQEIGIVIAFLHALADSSINNLFERTLKRLILKKWKGINPGEVLSKEMRKAVKHITPNSWGIEEDIPF